MKQRTLKEVAQAGLVLGFEWIAKDGDGLFKIGSGEVEYVSKPHCNFWYSTRMAYYKRLPIADFPDLPPEKSLLKLSDIVEGE